MSTATLHHKLTFDELQARRLQVSIAINCREAARRYPALARPLREKMRAHALQLRRHAG